VNITVDGANVSVSKQGSGRPLLMLHGVPDSKEMWAPLMQRVHGEYTCYAPDLPGINESQLPADFEFSLESYGRFVNDLLDALGVHEPVVLALHDWGGIFGMSFACQFPERVCGIVGGSFPFTPHYRWHAWARVWRTPILGELSMLLMSKPLFDWELKRGAVNLPSTHASDTFNRLRWANKRTILKLYRSLDPETLARFQDKLVDLMASKTIHFIWGEQDIYVPEHFGRTLNPSSHTVLPGCGHWVPVEATEQLAQRLTGMAL